MSRRRPAAAAGARTLAVEHLTKRFGERLAVDDVSFTVSAGEVFGFLGPNGPRAGSSR
jgi:ABC-2 type transport system ATP-binding protein